MFNQYFNWLTYHAYTDLISKINHTNLSYILLDHEFTYLPMDENRSVDGLDLRKRFCLETHNDICKLNSIMPSYCTIFEMILALAFRANDILPISNANGNGESNWFEKMLTNMGLYDFTNDRFDIKLVEYKLNHFLEREFNANGSGSLFTFDTAKEDMRIVDIWTSMCWYINELDEKITKENITNV